jgi:hypothetical protein
MAQEKGIQAQTSQDAEENPLAAKKINCLNAPGAFDGPEAPGNPYSSQAARGPGCLAYAASLF